jgi:hypothetical protein
MKLILIFLISLSPTISYSKVTCLTGTVEEFMTDTSSQSNEKNAKGNHTLIYSKESCGIQGCDYFIFSEIAPGCKVLSFNKKGLIIPGSFRGQVFKFRYKKETLNYRYSHGNTKFQVTR